MRNTEITHVQEILRHIRQALEFIDGQSDHQAAPIHADLEDAMKRGEILIREWRREQDKAAEQRLSRRYNAAEDPDYDDIT